MNPEYYSFKVGAFTCTAINDGTFTYAPPTFPPPANFLFINAAADRLNRVLGKYGLKNENWKEWTSPYICLLINTGKQKVLIDTGAGNLGTDTGKILKNLKNAGVSAEEIDIVILTHGHPDHLGGNVNSVGEVVFPRARWIMAKKEWQFWNEQAEHHLAEHGREMLISIARKNLLPLKDRIYLVDKETEIIPGIKTIDAPGHTPGLIALSIHSEGESLMCISDVVIHPIHLEEPSWYAAVDVVPDLLASTRQRIMAMASVEKALVIAFHFPFPGLGYIVPTGNVWRWEPVKERVHRLFPKLE
jgi:glyoxylase-like metal-dependent hydrolase (beta-lactamase superfamily II)